MHFETIEFNEWLDNGGAMKATEFCYWLQGMFELSDPHELNAGQTDLIKRHLAMAFLHDIDKQAGDDAPKLEKLHGGSMLIAGTPPGNPPHPTQIMRC